MFQETYNSVPSETHGSMQAVLADSHLTDDTKPKRGRGKPKSREKFKKRYTRDEQRTVLKKKVSEAVASGDLEKLLTDQEYRHLCSNYRIPPEYRIVELKNGEKRVFRELYTKVSSKPPEFKLTAGNLLVCSQCKIQVKDTIDGRSDHIKKSHSRQFSFKCTICSYFDSGINSDSDIGNIHLHIRRSHLKNDDCFQCQKCGKNLWVKQFYERHMKNCTGSYEAAGVCSLCGKYCKVLSVHMKSHRPRSIHCLKCPLVFKHQAALSKHVKYVHNATTEDQAICGVCGKIFKNKHYVQAHKNKVHTTKLHKCTYQGCNKEFKTKDALKKHALIHSNEKPMSCEYCEFTCRQRNSMDVHMKTHHKGRTYDRPERKYGTKVKGKYIHVP